MWVSGGDKMGLRGRGAFQLGGSHRNKEREGRVREEGWKKFIYWMKYFLPSYICISPSNTKCSESNKEFKDFYQPHMCFLIPP